MREMFENWFLGIPDVDESLLNKDKRDNYIDTDIALNYEAFKAGSELQKSICLSLIQAVQVRFASADMCSAHNQMNLLIEEIRATLIK